MHLFRKKQAAEYIVCFLGNPGPRYAATRHNAGFLTADALASALGIKINKLKFEALTNITTINRQSVLLMKPQTFMNLSGDAASQAMRFYKVPIENLIVISDDISLPLGKLRVRRSGSAGGHNGLKDIISKCGGDNFPRIKIGVGEKPRPEMDLMDWVLASFNEAEMKVMKEAAKKAAQCAAEIITYGIESAMSKYN